MKTDRRSLFLSFIGGALAAVGLRGFARNPGGTRLFVDGKDLSDLVRDIKVDYCERIAAVFDVPPHLIRARTGEIVPLRVEKTRARSEWRYAAQRRPIVIRRTFNAHR